MATGMTRPQAPELTSWKEIASYLGKGVRTVQRWECHFGLPVRRPNEKSKGVVYASRSELDRWLATHWSQRPGKPNGKQPSLGADIETSRELRSAHRELMVEVRRSLQLLKVRCDELASHMSRAEDLKLRSVFPLLNRRPPPRLVSRLRPIGNGDAAD